MSVRCGNHRDQPEAVYHETVADVRACYAPAPTAPAEPAQAPAPIRPAVTRVQLATIPVGTGDTAYYAIRSATGEVEHYQVERPSEGSFAGATFVRPRHSRANLVGAERARVFAAILVDPLEAARLYGETTGECSQCGRELRKQESVDAGMGPWCRSRFGERVAA